jgi:NADH dehydrogenase FAD-containing subunit
MAQDLGATFIEDRVVLVDPVRRTLVLGSGAEVRYDAVSFNTGSTVPLDLLHPSGDNVFPVKPIENILAARRMITEAHAGKRIRVIVVGGGSAAVQMAANLGHLAKETGRIGGITLVSRSNVLGDFPEKARTLARGPSPGGESNRSRGLARNRLPMEGSGWKTARISRETW